MADEIKAGQRVVYVIPERRYRGEVLEVSGKVAMVKLTDPDCVVQVTVDMLKVRPSPKVNDA